ncbi:MAG: bifunctional diaminohydroxyphosphoribosylaminopyrimidine deaminase/5-amino-6-(5-phosphoribosylamino)uracil reductase RibD [Epsilonproteobacteria bacterium]|nr:bifunctional diaminohydroxyphosphoribosylaminopyrimidine deaminase/5-amino-6-(5-phosphoribosylamino)uracil reductase RibD [Campylobacterota bacterium]
MEIDHNFYMKLALDEAWEFQLLTYPNPAVGCCVVGEHGEVLAVAAHQRAGEAHAEVLALQQAYAKLSNDATILELQASADIHDYLLQNHNNIFQNCTLYTTLEPCSHHGKTPSCANLLVSLHLKSVVVGANDFNSEAANGIKILEEAKVDVTCNVMAQGCKELLIPFQKYIEGRFVFFKWAQRLNGTFDDGSITCGASKTLVHKMRDVCDLLVIGGNTVRVDRPTLDARLVGGKAPDVLILSKQKEFDTTIPLFNVPNRRVFIADNLEKINEYHHVMIEGGESMYELTKEVTDLYLCFVAPKFGGKLIFAQSKDQLRILKADKVGEDIILWMKKVDNE